MPEWIYKATCAKCKKKGHLAFNCPPEYGNKIVKSNKFPKKKEPRKPESAAHVTEFAGIGQHKSNHYETSGTNTDHLFDKQKDNLLTLLIGHNTRETAKKYFVILLGTVFT